MYWEIFCKRLTRPSNYVILDNKSDQVYQFIIEAHLLFFSRGSDRGCQLATTILGKKSLGQVAFVIPLCLSFKESLLNFGEDKKNSVGLANLIIEGTLWLEISFSLRQARVNGCILVPGFNPNPQIPSLMPRPPSQRDKNLLWTRNFNQGLSKHLDLTQDYETDLI